MGITRILMTNVSKTSRLDASGLTTEEPMVSDFLTIQSLSNFAAMTGAITAAWRALQLLNPDYFSALWVPYLFAVFFGLISVLISLKGLKKEGSTKLDLGDFSGAVFIALINALVLASAVVGANVTLTPTS